MSKENWVLADEFECGECGASAEVLTSSKKEGYYFDGDNVRCTECDLKGGIDIHEDEDGNAYAFLQWDY